MPFVKLNHRNIAVSSYVGLFSTHTPEQITSLSHTVQCSSL